jgi:hypothetical protein
MLLVALLLPAWEGVKGESKYIDATKMIINNNLQSYGYIEFSMPVYEWDDRDECVARAIFKASIDDGSTWTNIFEFSSSDGKNVSWTAETNGQYKVDEGWQTNNDNYRIFVRAWLNGNPSSVGNVKLMNVFDVINVGQGSSSNVTLTTSESKKYMVRQR